MKKLWNLPKAQAEAWVKALRSGKYKLGKGWLYTLNGKHSALGVYAVTNGIEVLGNLDASLSGTPNWCTALYVLGLPKCLDVITTNTCGASLEHVISVINEDKNLYHELSDEVNELDIIYEIHSGQRDSSFETIADFIECHVNFIEDEKILEIT